MTKPTPYYVWQAGRVWDFLTLSAARRFASRLNAPWQLGARVDVVRTPDGWEWDEVLLEEGGHDDEDAEDDGHAR